MPALLEPHEVANLGAFLRNGRERRGLTIDQISSATRIPRRHLDALEHGELHVIPGGMYRRAEVRAFADAVGIDRNQALAHLEHALDQNGSPEAARRPVLDPPRRQWGAYAALALLAVTSLAVATQWQWATPAPEVERAQEIAAPAVAGPADVVTPVGDAQAMPAPPGTAPPKASTLAVASSPAVQSASPVAPQVETALVVTSTPAGARVLVDGIGWGRTPLTIRNVAPGDRRIRVVLDGFVGAERHVRVASGRKNVTAHVNLTAAN